MNNKIKSLAALNWVVFVDSVGWGIAFSIYAALLLNHNTSLLPESVSESNRYMLYEFLLAIYCVFMFFFAPVLGGVVDRYGRKPGLLLSMSGLSVGFIICALGCYYSSLSLLVLGRIISGITAGSMSIAQAAAIDLSTPQNKSRYLSILMLSNSIGFSLGPVLGSVLMHLRYGPTGFSSFIVAAAMSMIGLVSIKRFFAETYFPAKNQQHANILQEFANIKIAFTKPILNIYLYATLFAMIAFGLGFSDLPVFISRLFPEHTGSTDIILSLDAMVFSFSLMFGGNYLFNYFGKKQVALFCMVMQLLVYVLMALCLPSYSLMVLFSTLMCAFTGLMYISLVTLISDATDSDWQGRVMGVMAALSSVSWGIGPLLTGALNFYGIAIAFMFSSLLMVLSMMALGRLELADKEVAAISS